MGSLLMVKTNLDKERDLEERRLREKREAEERYEKSIDSTLDRLQRTGSEDYDGMVPLFNELGLKLLKGKIFGLTQAKNLRTLQNGREKLMYPYDISTGGKEEKFGLILWSTEVFVAYNPK